jgi:hypothetical protein
LRGGARPAEVKVGKLQFDRARASIQWAQDDLDAGSADIDLATLRTRLDLAFEDLDFVREATRANNPEGLSGEYFLRASGHLALGGLLELDSRFSEARDTYKEAEEFLERAWVQVEESEGSDDLRSRIQNVLRRLDAEGARAPIKTEARSAE